MKHGALPICNRSYPATESEDVHNRTTPRSPPLQRSPPVSASPDTPAGLDAFLAHVLASRFAHTFVDRLLRCRVAVTLSRGVCVRLVFLRRLANGPSVLPGISISRVPRARQHSLITCGFASR